MAARQVTSWEFWIGVIVTILTSGAATFCSYQSTKDQIALQRDETKRAHASTLLKEISIGVADVRQHLLSYAGMALQLEKCLAASNASLQGCSRLPFAFDGILAQKAWRDLDANIKGAEPF